MCGVHCRWRDADSVHVLRSAAAATAESAFALFCKPVAGREHGVSRAIAPAVVDARNKTMSETTNSTAFAKCQAAGISLARRRVALDRRTVVCCSVVVSTVLHIVSGKGYQNAPPWLFRPGLQHLCWIQQASRCNCPLFAAPVVG